MRYIYEAPTPSDSLKTQDGEQNVLTTAAIEALPKPWVVKLKQAVLCAELNSMIALIKQFWKITIFSL